MALTYTFIEGNLTPQLMEALNLNNQLQGIAIRPLTVPNEVLDREPFVLSLSTGSSAIDVYLLDAPWVKSYSATQWLTPISGGKYDFDLSDYRPELLEVTSIVSKGERRVLAVPFETKGNILFYRKDLLDEAGFKPPGNWVELELQCDRILAERGGEDLSWGLLFHGWMFINDFYPIMWSFGGGIFEEDGSLRIDREENVNALAMVKRLLGKISPSFDEMVKYGLFEDRNAVERLFAQGKAVFMINWNTRWGDLERGLPGQTISMKQIGVAPIPGQGNGPGYSNIGSFCWGINFYSRHPGEARRFIELITSYEAQRWAALNHGILPARMDVLGDTEIARRAPSVLMIAKVFDKVVLRARPYQREINEELDNILKQVFQMDSDPRDALEYAQEKISNELARH